MAITAEENMGARMNTFQPDLIVEVTAACNRSCAGCYAPNVVTNKPASDLYAGRPELFLSIVNLNRAFGNLSTIPYISAVRGGEPSLHPKLATLLLMIKRHSHFVYLETHARWLLPENVKAHKDLIEAIKALGVIVKISFDKMHGLNTEDLHKITQFLDWNEIDFRIAITEPSLAEFSVTRSLCSWIPSEKIIYQPKAKSNSELVIPNLGVIAVTGEFRGNLSNIFSLMESNESLGMAQ